MKNVLSRRGLIRGAVAGAIVVGFDPLRRSWVTSAEALASSAMAGIPRLDGTLSTDPATLQLFADDFGHIVNRVPIAVLKPGSVQDIARMIGFAREHGLKIAMRGQGHATFGQAQVDGGIVVDSSTLATIHSIGPDQATVDGGVQWSDLVNAAYAQGLTPPVLTDY